MKAKKLMPRVGRSIRLLQRLLGRVGYRVSPMTAEEARYSGTSFDPSQPLPAGVEQDLRADHPRLQELRDRYARFECPAGVHGQWRDQWVASSVDLRYFRGDNAYVWQYRQALSNIELKTFTTLRYLRERDRHGLLERLEEDGRFGCWTFQFSDRKVVSRDLLDSVNEMLFLGEHADLFGRAGLRVLDIGAGYGRLAYRMATALPNLERYSCVDAVPQSTFLCEYYLRHRGCEGRTQVLPLDEFERRTAPGGFDLAVNVHSFSECTIGAIAWWIQQLVRLKVPTLFIVPNDADRLLSTEGGGEGVDFLPLLTEAGYELVRCEPIYADPDLPRLLGISDHFFLFRNPAFATPGST